MPKKTTRPFSADDAAVATRERIARATVEAEVRLMCTEVWKFALNIPSKGQEEWTETIKIK